MNLTALFLAMALAGGGVGTSLDTAPPVEGDWQQDEQGVVRCGDCPGVTGTVGPTIEIRSANQSVPIEGASVWIIPDGTVPLFATSTLRSDAEGKTQTVELADHRLRIAAEGHELQELKPPWPATVVLWPAGPRTLRVLADGRAAEGVRIGYAPGEGGQPMIETLSDTHGEVIFSHLPRAGIRVEVIDDRFTWSTSLLSASTQAAVIERSPVRSGTPEAATTPVVIELTPAEVITARVLDTEGRGISGAEAVAWLSYGASPRDVRKRSWNANHEGTIAIRGLPPGSHRITFQADGFFSETLRSTDLHRAPITLRAGKSPAIRVSGPGGLIEGALIYDQEQRSFWRTNASGMAVLHGVDSARRPLLEISAPNHLEARVALDPEDGSVIDVMLEEGGVVRVRLIDQRDGRPVPAAQFRVQRRGGWQGRDLESADGDYRISGFTPGPGSLTIRSESHLTKTIPFDGGSNLDLGTVFLSRGATVRGTLVSARTGEPLAGAIVEVPYREEHGSIAARFLGHMRSVTSDADGVFEISGLQGGPLCGSIQHPELNVVPLALAVEPMEAVDLGVLSFGNFSSVEVRVIDEEGATIEGAVPELRSGPLYSPCATRSASSAANGRFVFTGVPSGRWSVVAKMGPEVLGASAIQVEEQAGSLKAAVVVPFVDVTGSVTLGGTPPDFGSIKLRAIGGDDFVPGPLFVSYKGAGIEGRQEPVSDIVAGAFVDVDAGGAFNERLRLTPGEYEIIFMHGDSWYYLRRELAEGVKRFDASVHLAGHRLSGWLFDAAGRPPADDWVTLEDHEGIVLRRERTGAAGEFNFLHLPAGPVVVRSRSGVLEAKATVDLQESIEGLTLRLGLTFSPAIQVTIDAAEDAARITAIYVTDGAETWRSVATDDTGRASIRFLRPGRYTLFGIDAAGGIHHGPEVQLSTAGASVSFEVEEVARAELIFDAAREGEPVQLRTEEGMTLLPILGRLGRSLEVGAGGRVILPPLSAGVWQVSAGSDQPATVDLDPGRQRMEID